MQLKGRLNAHSCIYCHFKWCVSLRGRFGGAITAALYLSEFIVPLNRNASSSPSHCNQSEPIDANSGGEGLHEKIDDAASKKPVETVWFHIDFMGSKNGQSEPQGLRAVFEYVKRLATTQ